MSAFFVVKKYFKNEKEEWQKTLFAKVQAWS